MTGRPEWLPEFSWSDVAMAFIVAALLVALSFGPASSCTVTTTGDNPTTTTSDG